MQRMNMASLFSLVALVSVGMLAGCGDAAASLADASLSSEQSEQSEQNAQKYLGTWNYDQPDLATLNNVAVMACPDGGGTCDNQLPLPLQIPQVGWVVFSPGPNGSVNGQTDQGCTWNFTVTRTGLELSSTTQMCFNHNIGSAYNITQWSVTVEGNHEQERIVSRSFQPNGTVLIATMNSGSRTKVAGVGGQESFSHFLGQFTYDPVNFSTLDNVVSTDQGTTRPEQGMIQFTSDGYGTVVAHTPDGCSWTLAVRGNTAELDPATQTCQLASDHTVSLRYWAIVTDDGVRLSAFRSGASSLNGQQTNEFLFISSLTRSDR